MKARSKLFRLRHLARSAVGFSYFWVGGAVLGHAVLPLVDRTGGDRWERARRCQRVVRRATQHYHRFVRGLGAGEIDTAAYRAAIPAGPCVVVANHPSLLDVVAFLAAHEDLCVIAKGELFRGLFVGRLLRYCGHLDAGEGAHLDGAAVVQAALERLDRGFSVLVFPEGTRSPPGDMHQFKRGAFELAVRGRVPLLPVFVRCDPPAFAKGVPWYRQVPDEPFCLRPTPLALMDWRPWSGRARLWRKDVHRLVRERVEAWHCERAAPEWEGPATAPRARTGVA